MRCPVGQVQYSIQIDDILNSITLECPDNEVRSISFSKNEARSTGQLLATYDSELFSSNEGCKVKISITNGIDRIGYTIWQETVSSQVTNLVCGELAFNNNLQSSNLTFLRPEGYLSGWISSDPATVILSNGISKTFANQFVLIIDDLPSVNIYGVTINTESGKANTWGCWFVTNEIVAPEAKKDFCVKQAANQFAEYSYASEAGFEELGTTTTISCP